MVRREAVLGKAEILRIAEFKSSYMCSVGLRKQSGLDIVGRPVSVAATLYNLRPGEVTKK